MNTMRTNNIDLIAESYINGNISWTKGEVKKMSKVDFLYFIKVLVRVYEVDLDKINNLLWGACIVGIKEYLL